MQLKVKSFSTYYSALLHILYPQNCLVCSNEAPNQPIPVCPICLSDLNYTNYEAYTEPTRLDTLFWGRVLLQGTYALLRFKKRGSTQQLLHALKYDNTPEIGIYFGREIAERLENTDWFKQVEVLVPVPLHPRKKFIRGYNQAEMICKGISEISNKPIDNELLKRASYTESQTKKNKFARWENMQNRFKSNKQRELKHILVVDDVITTGSTLETCLQTLKVAYPEATLSVVAMAFAD